MKLIEFPAWKISAETYWTSAIDASGYSNAAAMIDSLGLKLEDLQAEYQGYLDVLGGGDYKRAFQRFLFQLVGYVSLRLGAVTPDEETVGIPELVPNEDVRNMIRAYSLELPEVSELFEIQEGYDPPGVGVLSDTAYTGLLSQVGLTNVASDFEALAHFQNAFSEASYAKSLYMAYGSPPTTRGIEKNVRDYIREDMGLLEVMTSLGISFWGVDHHYYSPDGTRVDV